jgi:hypothetical protein
VTLLDEAEKVAQQKWEELSLPFKEQVRRAVLRAQRVYAQQLLAEWQGRRRERKRDD